MEEFLKDWLFLIILLTVATGLSFVWLFVFNRKKLNAKWWEILIVAILHTVIGVGCVKLFALLEAGFDASKAGNLSMFGGIFFMPVFYIIYAKIKKLPILFVIDIFSISLVMTLLLARINCLYSGCCLGKSINYDIRYPTREIEIGYDAIIIALSIFFLYKGMFKNKVFFIYLLSYGVVRFILEFMRESDSGSVFHIGHVWSIVSVVFAVAAILIMNYLDKEKEIANSKKKKK